MVDAVSYATPDELRVAAYRDGMTFAAAWGAASEVQSVATSACPQATPTEPTNLTAVVNANGSVTLTWNAPDDDLISGYLVSYR